MVQPIKRHLTAEELLAFFQKKLHECYPAGIPPFAEERISQEIAHMKSAHAEESLLLCYELSYTSAHSGHILQVDGSSVGSLLVHLLTQGRINPLPAHYYCTECGHYEFAEGVTFGLDLPEKHCPYCGTDMRRDGYNIPEEMVWRVNGTRPLPMEYRCSEGFFPFGYQVIKEFYERRGRSVIPRGGITTETDCRLLEPIGVYILPKGKCVDDYPQYAAHLADGTPCFVGGSYEAYHGMKRDGIDHVILSVSNVADALYRAQAASGVFSEDVSVQGLTARDITNTAFVSSEECVSLLAMGTSYYDMACALTLPHNNYWDDDEEERTENRFYCREDAFDALIKVGIDRKTAARIADRIRLGQTQKIQDEMMQLGVPKETVDLAGNCINLFPRGSGAQRLISLLLLARYMRTDSKLYFDAIRPIQQTLR